MPSIIRLVVVAIAGLGALAGVAQDPARRVATIDLTIGGDDDREEYSFVSISGLAFAPDGRIIVTDFRDDAVKVFDASGQFAYSIGRRGSGPGEYRSPMGAAFDRDSLLWIRDENNHRYNAYQLGPTGASYRTQVRFSHGPGVDRIAPVVLDDSGRLVSISAMHEVVGRPASHARFVLARDGSIARADTIRPPASDSMGERSVTRPTPGGGYSTQYYFQPFGPGFRVAHSPTGEFARVITSRYDIEWFGPDGRTLRTLRRAVEGPPVSNAERQRAQAYVDDYVKRAGAGAPSVPGVPRLKAPVSRIAFDADGNLWVERSVREGAPREADVYSRDGRLFAAIQWPADVDLLSRFLVPTVGTHVLGVATDSLGTHRVVRMKWR